LRDYKAGDIIVNQGGAVEGDVDLAVSVVGWGH
jgi:hypothetical protein